jgi:hypothetical protein
MTREQPGLHDDWTLVTRGKSSFTVSSDPGCDCRTGRFWALEEKTEDDEEELTTLTTDEFIEAASHAGFSIEELLQAEAKLQDVGKISQASPGSAEFRCPRASKIIPEIARGKSLKDHMNPWKGPLPKPRVSPPRMLGDAVIKNSCIRLRGGRLVPQTFKMVLSSTNIEPASNSVHSHNASGIPIDWPALPESSSMKRESSQATVKGAKSAMNTHEIKGFQNSNEF